MAASKRTSGPLVPTKRAPGVGTGRWLVRAVFGVNLDGDWCDRAGAEPGRFFGQAAGWQKGAGQFYRSILSAELLVEFEAVDVGVDLDPEGEVLGELKGEFGAVQRET